MSAGLQHTSFRSRISSMMAPLHQRIGINMGALSLYICALTCIILYSLSLGAIADLDLVIRCKKIEDDIMVVRLLESCVHTVCWWSHAFCIYVPVGVWRHAFQS